MKQVSENNWEGSSVMLGPLLADLTTKFCSGNRWMLRQSYVNICNQLVTDRALPLEEFAKLLLEPLLALKQDRVPNVRLVLARVINLQLKYHGNTLFVNFFIFIFILFFYNYYQTDTCFSFVMNCSLLVPCRIFRRIGQSLPGVAVRNADGVIGRFGSRRFLLRHVEAASERHSFWFIVSDVAAAVIQLDCGVMRPNLTSPPDTTSPGTNAPACLRVKTKQTHTREIAWF